MVGALYLACSSIIWLTCALDLDRSKSSMKKTALGGSLFSSTSGPSAPPEIEPLVALQIQVSKTSATLTTAVPTADTEFDKLTDPSKAVPTPPVYAARLSALLKNLVSAETAVAESLKARTALLEGLQKLVETNETALAAEKEKHSSLSSRKTAIESKKREVEDGIMRGLSAENSPLTLADGRANGSASEQRDTTLSVDPERPDVEALTPPAAESLTPTDDIEGGADAFEPSPAAVPPQPSVFNSPPPSATATSGFSQNMPGSDLLSSLNVPAVRRFSGSMQDGGNAAKRRRIAEEEAVFGSGSDAMADLDEDVAELLRAESGGR